VDYNVQVLFLHNLTPQNQEVTIQNFNSFKEKSTDILGVCDEDQKGLKNSFYIPLNSYLPRSNYRWPHPDVPIINYILINKDKLTHSHYMICEYDCFTDCNINELCEPYKNHDVTVPNIVTYEKEPSWQWFQNLKHIEDKKLLIGFRPSVFILFKKEALIKLAEEYKQNWENIQNLNVESRLGFLSKKIGLDVKEFKDLKININWFEINFIKNNKIYHPIKKPINQCKFIEFGVVNSNCNKIGKWSFGRVKDRQTLGTICLNPDNSITEYENFNEKFWEEKNNELLFYNGFGKLTTQFTKVQDNIYIGDYYHNKIEKNYHFLIRIKN
jgi:hypothetical protein